MDGVRVLEKWRKDGKTMPVLILTARDRWSDKVAGFDAGADDYLAKPFYTEELLARVRALLRRAAGLATSEIEIGPLRIDTRASRVTMDGSPVKLTSLEYRLLAYLAHHRGRVRRCRELQQRRLISPLAHHPTARPRNAEDAVFVVGCPHDAGFVVGRSAWRNGDVINCAVHAPLVADRQHPELEGSLRAAGRSHWHKSRCRWARRQQMNRW